MCGRFNLYTAPDEVRATFGYVDRSNFPPRYNIAPTQAIAVVRLESGTRRLALVRWGLIPAWVKNPNEFSLLLQARSETAAEKVSFRNALRRRRCLIPANGFYEWRQTGTSAKQAYFVRPVDGGVMAMAGIWDAWMGPDGEEMETVAVLTTRANRTLSSIHHRMPVVIAPNAFAQWLDPLVDKPDALGGLFEPVDDGFLAAIPIGNRVNKVANDDAHLLAPIDPASDTVSTIAPDVDRPDTAQMRLL